MLKKLILRSLKQVFIDSCNVYFSATHLYESMKLSHIMLKWLNELIIQILNWLGGALLIIGILYDSKLICPVSSFTWFNSI